jgi:hypothetical protein
MSFWDQPRRPSRFKLNQIVEIEVDYGVWVPGKVIRRLRKGEELPFKPSLWQPIATWYLVQLDADGSLHWVRKIDLRLPGGPSAY